MKKTLSVLLLSIMVASCGHVKKEKSPKDNYTPVISYQIENKKYEARIEFPKTFKEKLPLVVIIHEWWGRTPYLQDRAEMLKKEGFATLVVDLYGNGQTVETPAEAQALATPFYQKPEQGIERLNKYLMMARQDPHIDSNKIFVIGYCFGGTQALNLARSGADIKGVVSFHGGLASTVKAGAIKAKILAINGLADPMVPAKERAGFEKEMKAAKAEYQMINYPGATHAFTNPKATEVGKRYNIPIAYNKKADEGSWKDLLQFLRK